MQKIKTYKEIKHPAHTTHTHIKKIVNIINYIKKYKDDGLVKLTQKYEHRKLKKAHIKVKINQLPNWKIEDTVKTAIKACKNRVIKFHKTQRKKLQLKSWLKKTNGTIIGQQITPIRKIGIYIPGGNKIYPSSIIMNTIPALIAGVPKIILVTPAPIIKQSKVLLYTAKQMNITTIYNVGGAQAIAALAKGTKRIPKVNKIVGPGNQYVNLAKKALFGETGIDKLAGPTEIGLLINSKSRNKKILTELLAQLEHDKNCAAFILSNSTKKLKLIRKLLTRINNKIHNTTLKTSISRTTFIVEKNIYKQAKIINYLAPEHLSILTNHQPIIKYIKNSGSIISGKYNSSSLSDYSIGTNHVLPTHQTSKFTSPLNITEFINIKNISIINQPHYHLNKTAKVMAQIEQLKFHKQNIW
ncbi:histidinol dehydrogenase [Candidatus Vidania fulgoroideae]|uniref:Histidinol dehydrogenase n=1 Tax=Candidatus Vidania fulgoroideorum TaxID=881286 RepID=A0A974X6W5_9PROT|nr:histidinol dehydrogenase [Candidatus Vidania fulgoroideae]